MAWLLFIYLVDASVEEDQEYKWNYPKNYQFTPIVICCVDWICSKFCWVQDKNFIRGIRWGIKNFIISDFGLKKSCNLEQGWEQCNTNYVFENTFGQCVGFMHGLTGMETMIKQDWISFQYYNTKFSTPSIWSLNTYLLLT